MAAIVYMLESNVCSSAEDALQRLEDGQIFEGSLHDYACELIDSCFDLKSVPDVFRTYFDYEAYARDIRLSGDADEFHFGGKKYVLSGF